MAVYKLVNAEQLDGAVQATADAIKTKGETTEKIPWNKDTGFRDAVLAIQSGGEKPQLIVTAPAGSTITAVNVNEEETVTGEIGAEGTLTIDLPAFGTWIVTATLGEAVSDPVTVNVIQEYAAELSYEHIYGISRDITNSSPDWVRTDDAVGLTSTASIGTSAGASDFDNCKPWSGIQRETLATGDVMVKIPAFWYQRYRDGDVEHIRISDRESEGFELHPAFARPSGNVDYIYVGAYKTGMGHISKTGLAPLVNITRAAFRTGAKGKGGGWGIIDIAALSAVQMLMLVEFATNDVQSAIGNGYCGPNNNAPINTGSCDDVPNLTGRPSGTADRVDVVWRGIEGFWGNYWEYVDGLNFNNGAYYVCNDPSKYADNTASNYTALSYTGATNWSGSYITQEGLDTANSWCMMPSEAGGGSGSTYFPDTVWSAAGWKILTRGVANYAVSTTSGLFAMSINGNSTDASNSNGSRLLYIPY